MAKEFIEEFVSIGGLSQYILHYPGARADSPVLLLLHGGPGSSEANFSYLFRQWWGDGMTLVQYDQRGSGKTLHKNPKYDTYPITKSSMLADLAEVIAHLKKRYNQEKVILMGHSWGTVLGADYARKYPADISLYIGVGQVVDMKLNERLGFEKALEMAQKAGNMKDVQKLQKLSPYPPEEMHTKEGYRVLTAVRKVQQKYGLAIRLPLPLVLAFIKSPSFKWSDLTTMLFKAGKVNLPLLKDLMKYNLNEEDMNYRMPVCCIQGEKDYQTVTPVALAYFEKVQSPKKQIHVIKDAGHMTMVDQPEQFADALRQALTMLEA